MRAIDGTAATLSAITSEVRPVPEHGGDGEAEQDRGEGKQHVDQSHQWRVEALEVGGAEADQGAEPAADRDREHADAECGAQSEQDAAHHVAALVVGAQQIGRAALAADRAEAQPHVVGVGIERRDPWRQHGRQNDREKEECGGGGRRILEDAPPHRVLAPDRRYRALVGFALQREGGVGHARAIRGSR